MASGVTAAGRPLDVGSDRRTCANAIADVSISRSTNNPRTAPRTRDGVRASASRHNPTRYSPASTRPKPNRNSDGSSGSCSVFLHSSDAPALMANNTVSAQRQRGFKPKTASRPSPAARINTPNSPARRSMSL
ncbi:MAG: hypothetical protein IT185_03280 [Acidobacteria bacterium]|nr:hypothetical protein [Acidobacteriota bacterium]